MDARLRPSLLIPPRGRVGPDAALSNRRRHLTRRAWRSPARTSRARVSDDVWIVAPETDQSGVSHSLSLNDPLRLREVDERRISP